MSQKQTVWEIYQKRQEDNKARWRLATTFSLKDGWSVFVEGFKGFFSYKRILLLSILLCFAYFLGYLSLQPALLSFFNNNTPAVKVAILSGGFFSYYVFQQWILATVILRQEGFLPTFFSSMKISVFFRTFFIFWLIVYAILMTMIYLILENSNELLEMLNSIANELQNGNFQFAKIGLTFLILLMLFYVIVLTVFAINTFLYVEYMRKVKGVEVHHNSLSTAVLSLSSSSFLMKIGYIPFLLHFIVAVFVLGNFYLGLQSGLVERFAEFSMQNNANPFEIVAEDKIFAVVFIAYLFFLVMNTMLAKVRLKSMLMLLLISERAFEKHNIDKSLRLFSFKKEQ